MDLDIIQWNISYNSKVDKVISYLKSQISDNCVVCLQEVLGSSKEKILNHLQPTDYRFSLDIRPPGKFDGKNRKLGLLTLTFGNKITESHLIERSVFPERTLLVQIDFGDSGVSILNFHSLTGVGYKRAKSSNFASIAEYLSINELDFFCCDANEPKTDDFDVGKLEFWDNGDKGKYPSLIFGINKVHNLGDSFRSIKNPGNKLPISYKTGKTYRRYDMIFNSKNWKVKDLEYKYEESIKASSDHALVIGKYDKNSA